MSGGGVQKSAIASPAGRPVKPLERHRCGTLGDRQPRSSAPDATSIAPTFCVQLITAASQGRAPEETTRLAAKLFLLRKLIESIESSRSTSQTFEDSSVLNSQLCPDYIAWTTHPVPIDYDKNSAVAQRKTTGPRGCPAPACPSGVHADGHSLRPSSPRQPPSGRFPGRGT